MSDTHPPGDRDDAPLEPPEPEPAPPAEAPGGDPEADDDLEAMAQKLMGRAEDLAGKLVDTAERWVRQAADEPEAAADEATAPPGEKLLPVRQKLLPAPLSRFAPPDPEGERRTAERLQRMTLSALRARRQRIDRRLHELGLAIGEPALRIPSIRGTGLLDLDRILRKVDRLEEAREQARLEREVDRADATNVLERLGVDLDWVSEVFANREVRTRRDMLVAELGLALCACDHEVLATYAPHVKELVDSLLPAARRIDELFVEARLVDAEFERRRREGLAEATPKEIDRLLARAMDSVDEASSKLSSKVGGTLADLGKGAAKTGGQTAWALARGAAAGAWSLGTRRLRGDAAGEDDLDDLDDLPTPPPATSGSPRPTDVPRLIRELAKLRDDGLLSPAEFERKKAELLRRL